MKLEDQVCSLELAKRLKELGLKQDSYFWWDLSIPGFVRVHFKPCSENDISAFSVAELGEMLPLEYKTQRSREKWWHGIDNTDASMGYTVSGTEADARAKTLIYLIENKLVGEGKV